MTVTQQEMGCGRIPTKQLAFKALVASGAPALWRWLTQDRVAVLCYHGVSSSSGRPGVWNADGVHVGLDRFEAQMAYLKRRQQPVPLSWLCESLEGSRRLPARAVVVTFDDGLRSVVTRALPVLQKHGIPAALFVVAEAVGGSAPLWTYRLGALIDRLPPGRVTLDRLGQLDLTTLRARRLAFFRVRQRLKLTPAAERADILKAIEHVAGPAIAQEGELLDWEEVRRLAEEGFEIGCHSATHENLTLLSADASWREVAGAKATIEERLGRPVKAFAYPDGFYNERVVEAVRSAGFSLGLTTDPGLNRPAVDPFRVKRLLIGDEDPVAFGVALTGIRVVTSAAAGLGRRLARGWRP